jgi:hypothetical protein
MERMNEVQKAIDEGTVIFPMNNGKSHDAAARRSRRKTYKKFSFDFVIAAHCFFPASDNFCIALALKCVCRALGLPHLSNTLMRTTNGVTRLEMFFFLALEDSGVGRFLVN